MTMRFSLRTILASILIVAIALSIVLFVTKDYRERMALQAELLSMGADFAHVNSDRSIRLFFAHPIKSTEITKYGEIESLELKGFRVDSDSLRNLNSLKHVEVMLFQSCTIDNPEVFAPLAEIGCVDSLLIWNTPFADDSVDAIARIPGLKVVDFSNTQVTQAGLDRLRSALPDVTVRIRP